MMVIALRGTTCRGSFCTADGKLETHAARQFIMLSETAEVPTRGRSIYNGIQGIKYRAFISHAYYFTLHKQIFYK